MTSRIDTPPQQGCPPGRPLPWFSLFGGVLLMVLLVGSRPAVGQVTQELADLSSQNAPDKVGRWSAPVDVGVIGIHAVLLHTRKVLFWQYPNSGPGSPAILYDPKTGKVRHVDVPFARDIFCSGQSVLSHGRVLVAGGNNDNCSNPNDTCGIPDSEIFDPVTEMWSDNAKTKLARWYPTNVLMPDGTSLTLSGMNAAGTDLVKPMESYDPAAEEWTQLPESADIPGDSDLFPRMVVLPSGKVFNAGVQPNTYMFDPASDTWSFVATMNALYRAGEGVVLLPGLQKVLAVGGQASDGGERSAEIIDLSKPKPT